MRYQFIQTPMLVVDISGEARVVGKDGIPRLLHEGEILPPGTLLVQSENAKVVLEPGDMLQQDKGQQASDQEIAAAQQAIMEGADPTRLFAAPAAGGPGTQAGVGGIAGESGNGGFVVVDRTGDTTIAQAGFDTSHQSAPIGLSPIAPTVLQATPSIGFTQDNISVAEGDPAIFSVEVRDAAPGSTLSLSLVPGTATADLDYSTSFQFKIEFSLDNGQSWQAYEGPIALPEGSSHILVRDDTVDDNLDEVDETFQLHASLSSAGSDYAASGTATILDNDAPTLAVNPGVEANNIVVDEGAPAVFTVQINEAAAGSALTLALQAGTASAGLDYATAIDYSLDGGASWQAYSGPVGLPEGDSTLLVRAQTQDDSLDEIAETFQLHASLSSAGSDYAASGTATILDNDGPSVRINPSNEGHNIDVAEGDPAVFTVQISDAAAGSALTLALQPGTASAGLDYATAFDYSLDGGASWQAYSDAIGLPEGDSTLLVRTQTQDDSLDEIAETFQLHASLSSAGSDFPASGTATILDNDAPSVRVNPNNEIHNIDVAEGDPAVFTVQINDAATGSTLALALQAGTASAGLDYATAFDYSLDGGASWQAYSGPVGLPEGDSTLLVRTQTQDDSLDEIDETFQLHASLSSAGSDYAASGIATILDDDGPSVRVNPSNEGHNIDVAEGDPAVFTVQINEAATGSALALALQAGTASAGLDYATAFDYSLDGGSHWQAYSDAISLPEGDSTLLVRTQTQDDSLDEVAETFQLHASLSSAGNDYPASGTATILDNDTPMLEVNPGVAANNIDVAEGAPAVFTVQINGAATGSALALALQAGTASVGLDYATTFDYSLDGGATWQAYSDAIGLPEGDSTLLVRTQTQNDSLDEIAETFQLHASLSSAGSDYAASGTATILDDDAPMLEVNPGVEANNIDVTEGAPAVFTVQINDAAAGSALALALQAGTASAGLDYATAFDYSLDGGATWQAYSDAIGLPEGDSSVLVRADTLADDEEEGSETFQLHASLSSAGSDYAASGTATILDTDAPLTIEAETAKVYEDELADGTSPNPPAKTSGSFDVSAGDGIVSLTVGGIEFSLAQLQAATLLSPLPVTTPLGNSLLITGYAGDGLSGTVSYTYLLLDNEQHLPIQGPNWLNDTISLQLTDDNGDTSTVEALSIKVVDDVPVLDALQNAVIANSQGVTTGILDVNFGADGGGFNLNDNVSPDPNLVYTVANHPDGSSELTATVIGTDEVFFVLNVATDGTYAFDLLNPNPTIPVSESLLGLTAGKPVPSFELFFNGSGSGSDLSAVFSAPDGVNSSGNGMGVGNNLIGTGEWLTVDFNQDVYNAAFVLQKMSSGETLKWEACDDQGGLLAAGTFTMPGGHGENDQYVWNLLTDPGTSFTTGDAASLEGSGFDSLKLGAESGTDYRLLSLTVYQELFPGDLDLTFNTHPEDNDGDKVTDAIIAVHIEGEGNDSVGFFLTGDDSSEVLQGGDGHDHLYGHGGSDTLVGGLGSDILVGGDGADEFLWKSGDADGSIDTIRDFDVGTDTLDLADVLNSQPGEQLLDHYLHFEAQGTNAVIEVYSNGDYGQGGAVADVTIVLNDLASTPQELTDLQDYLLNQNGLING